jgi:hypothetical protein
MGFTHYKKPRSFSEGTWQQLSLLSFLFRQSSGSCHRKQSRGSSKKTGISNKHGENQKDIEKSGC